MRQTVIYLETLLRDLLSLNFRLKFDIKLVILTDVQVCVPVQDFQLLAPTAYADYCLTDVFYICMYIVYVHYVGTVARCHVIDIRIDHAVLMLSIFF